MLILDEPTSSLDKTEVGELFKKLRKLQEGGLGIIFITHFLEQVYEISDLITVLRNGRRVGCFATRELPRIKLVSHMIGKDVHEVEALEQKRASTATIRSDQPMLEAKGLGRKGFIHPLDLEIRPGEVLGLAGLLGSGRTETARLLFGVDRPDQGTLLNQSSSREIQFAARRDPSPYCLDSGRPEGGRDHSQPHGAGEYCFSIAGQPGNLAASIRSRAGKTG